MPARNITAMSSGSTGTWSRNSSISCAVVPDHQRHRRRARPGARARRGGRRRPTGGTASCRPWPATPRPSAPARRGARPTRQRREVGDRRGTRRRRGTARRPTPRSRRRACPRPRRSAGSRPATGTITAWRAGARAPRAGRLAHEHDAVGVTAERGDVGAQPRRPRRGRSRSPRFDGTPGGGEPPQRTQPVVQRRRRRRRSRGQVPRRRRWRATAAPMR